MFRAELFGSRRAPPLTPLLKPISPPAPPPSSPAGVSYALAIASKPAKTRGTPKAVMVTDCAAPRFHSRHGLSLWRPGCTASKCCPLPSRGSHRGTNTCCCSPARLHLLTRSVSRAESSALRSTMFAPATNEIRRRWPAAASEHLRIALPTSSAPSSTRSAINRSELLHCSSRQQTAASTGHFGQTA